MDYDVTILALFCALNNRKKMSSRREAEVATTMLQLLDYGNARTRKCEINFCRI